MATEGPRYCGTGAEDTSFGSSSWEFPDRAQGTADGSITQVILAPSTSYYLKCTNFGFTTIPSGATVDGIVVEFGAYGRFSSTVVDARMRIVKGGTIGSTDRSSATPWDTGGTFPAHTRGGSTDLWGESWTDTDIKSSGFGVAIACTNTEFSRGQVDWVRITVYYTAGGGGGVTYPMLERRMRGLHRGMAR